MKKKVLFCTTCGKQTAHTYVCGEKVGANCGFLPVRVALGVLTYGLSEIEFTKYFECPICHNLKTEYI